VNKIKPFPGGKHCFVIPYGDKLLKIFNFEDVDNWDKDICWGDRPKPNEPNMSVPLEDAIKIQNICWIYGLAPRVYSKVGVTLGMKKHMGVVTDKAEGERSIERAEEVYEKVKKIGEKYGFKNDKDDYSKDDVIGGKLVDFNTFHFVKGYEDKLKKQYIENNRYGKIYYHNVPELGLNNSPRKNDKRIKWLGLDKIDFNGKSVIDFGCAGGFFCRYAKDRGAGKVIGIDHVGKGSDNSVKGAKLVSNHLGYWDINFWDMDLEIVQHNMEADITFFLSMNYHVGIPGWVSKWTKELCVFEDNSKNRDALPELEKLFSKVERVGTAKDHGDKPIYWCWK